MSNMLPDQGKIHERAKGSFCTVFLQYRLLLSMFRLHSIMLSPQSKTGIHSVEIQRLNSSPLDRLSEFE